MPGLSGRMSTVIKAKISKLLDRAEDPGETLEYSYQKQIELLQNVKKGIADVVTSKKRLQLQKQKLRAKIEQFRSKKEVIKAQYSAAEAQVRISEAATGVGEEMADVGLAMQRALDKTENMRARADAVQELEAAGTFEDLTQLGSGEDDIDRQLKALSSSTEVDAELAKMKAELGTGSASKGELGTGASGAGSESSGASQEQAQ